MELLRTVHRRVHDVLCRLKWELGQTTAEYALVLLAAAAVAMILIKWAGENDSLTGFFDAVVSRLTDSVKGS